MTLSLRALAQICFVATLVLVTAGPHATAQSDNPIVFPKGQPGARSPLNWLFGGREEKKASAPVQRTYQPKRRVTAAPRPAVVVPGVSPDAPVLPGDPAQPQVADAIPSALPAGTLHFAVIGDSLGGLLGQGLQEIYADRPFVTIHKKTRDSSGLVREDYYDWTKVTRELLAGSEKYDAILIMLGSNDRQPLRDERGVHEARSERWREIYADRIDAIIALAQAKRVPLVWVGLPVMRSERYAADMLAFNEIYRERAQRATIGYVDIWEGFATEQGYYSVTGPDVGGEIVRLRTSDGVHFTRAGARKVAYFADKLLQPIVAAAQARVDVAAVPSPGQTALPRSGDPLSISPLPELQPQLPSALRTTDSLLGVAAPDVALRSALQPRALAGPVQPLSAPPSAAGGQLVDGRAARVLGEEARRVFVDGLAAPAKPGRADDFRF